jgi:hypothetical protein
MRRIRRGTLLLEAGVAGALLAVLLAISLRVLATTAIERRAVEKRAVALEEAASAMERAAALPWDQLTPERLAQIRLTSGVEKILVGAKLQWTVEPSTSGPTARHLRATITWQSPTGAPHAPVRLSSWAFAAAGTARGESP